MKKKLNKLVKLFLALIMIFSQLSTVGKVLADEIEENSVDSVDEELLEKLEESEEELVNFETRKKSQENNNDQPGQNNDPTNDEEVVDLATVLDGLFTIVEGKMIFNAVDLKGEADPDVVISSKDVYDALADTNILVKINDVLVDEKTEEALLKNGDVLEFTLDEESVVCNVIVMGDVTDDSTFTDEDITTTMEGYLNEEDIISMDLHTPFGMITFEDVMLLNGYRNTKEEVAEEEVNLELELDLDSKEYYTEDEFEVNIVVKAPAVEPNDEEELGNNQDDTEETEEILDYINGIIGSVELSDNLELVNVTFNEKLLNAVKDNNFVAAGEEVNPDEIVLTLTIRAASEGVDSEIKVNGTVAKELGMKEYELTETVNVTKKVSNNNYLSGLGATVGSFDSVFDKENTVYTLTVPAGTEEVTLVGSLDDVNASVTGLTTYKLEEDKTVATILVNAEDGTTKNYFVYIVREVAPTPVVYYYSANNYLKLLKIKGHEIVFDKNTLEYKIEVTDVSSLDITAVAEDTNARVVITGNENFKEGENVVTISVTAENGNTREYKIIVNKVLDKGLEVEEGKSNTTEKIIIIVLIVLVVLGLLYLIFKKDDETPKMSMPTSKKESPDKVKKVNNNITTNGKSTHNKNLNNNKVKKGR